jgi:hypothetical protein
MDRLPESVGRMNATPTIIPETSLGLNDRRKTNFTNSSKKNCIRGNNCCNYIVDSRSSIPNRDRLLIEFTLIDVMGGLSS